jgi:tetratricopeptide (TPR) repeat protein
MRQGAEALEARQFEVARGAFEQALALAPESGPAHYGIAKAFFGVGKTRAGIEALRGAARLDAKSSEPKVQLAQMLLVAGSLEEALVEAQGAVEIEPARADTYLIQGQVLAKLGRMPEALQAFQQAVEREPDSYRAVLSLAVAHNNARQFEEAEAAFRRAVEIEPGFSAEAALARFLAQDQTRDEETEAALQRVIELAASPREVRLAHETLVGLYVQRERYDDARALLKAATEQHAANVELGYLLAQVEASAGNVGGAVSLLQQLAKENPTDTRPQLLLSSMMGKSGDRESAIVAARRAVEIDPGQPPARLRLAELLIDSGFSNAATGHVAEGRGLAESVLEDVPDHPGALMLLSKVALSEDRIDAAVTNLRAAVASAPNFARAHYRLGAALVIQGKKQAGRQALLRALEIEPDQLDARRLLVRVHAMLGSHEEAVEQARVVLSQASGEETIRVLAAENLVVLGRLEEAASLLKAIPASERSALMLHQLGRVLLQSGELEEARLAFGAALERDPFHHDTLRDMVPLDVQAGLFDVSVKRIEEAASGKPGDSDLRLLVGVVAVIDGRPQEAERSFKQALKLAPRNTQAYEHLARFYAMRGRLTEAVRSYEVAVAARPEDAHLHHFLGVLYQYGGNLNRAAKSYDKAVGLAPDLAESKNNLAYILAETGTDLDRALELAQDAVAQLGEVANVADTLGWVLVKRGQSNEAIEVLNRAEASALETKDVNSVGTIRQHLATAYMAQGMKTDATKLVESALSELDAAAALRKKQGNTASNEPGWATAMREMKRQLENEG